MCWHRCLLPVGGGMFQTVLSFFVSGRRHIVLVGLTYMYIYLHTHKQMCVHII